MVRALPLLAFAAGALGACFGAAMIMRPQQPAPGSTTKTQGDRIDQTRLLPLEAIQAPVDLGERAMAHVRTLVGFGPRYAGGEAAATASTADPSGTAPPPRRPTPGWSQQLDYIDRTLRELGLAVERDTWTDRRERITFTNLAARIPGQRPERILLACHHDTKCTTGHQEPERNFHFVGANDGASAVGLLLALAPVLQRAKLEATIELVFFDGEESLDWNWNDAARALFGSRRYVKRHRDAELLGQAPRIAALILLDMVGRTDLHIQEETYSTELLRKIALSAAVAAGHREQFFRRAEAANDDHVPFLDVGIPAVDLIDLKDNPHWHKPTDTLDNLSAASLQRVADVVLTMLPAVERAYVLQKQ
jgi:glutaminyl-peptide cyclotransferase